MRLHYVSYIHIQSYVVSAQVAILQVIWITFTARGWFLVWIAERVEVVGEEMGEERIQYLANNAELGSDLWGISLPLCNPNFPPFTYPHIHRLSNALKQIISFRLKAPNLVQIWNTISPFIYIHIILKVLLKKMIELMLVFSLPPHLAKPQPSCSFSRWWWNIGGWPDAITQCRPWSPRWSLKLRWWWQELLESSWWCGPGGWTDAF